MSVATIERIVIEDSYSPPGQRNNVYENAYDHGRRGTTGHFFNEAKKHLRLYRLIQAGIGYDGVGSGLVCLAFMYPSKLSLTTSL